MQCPFCKETIQEGAIKCRHCGSMLNSAPTQPQQAGYGTQQQAASNIDQLNVSDVWKTRFKAFQENGQAESIWYGYKFKSTNPVLAIKGGAIFNKNNYVSLCALMFCALWYFVKGMWKKGIVLAIIAIICGVIGEKIGGPFSTLGYVVAGTIAAYSGSYDYYKLKVLKQSSWW